MFQAWKNRHYTHDGIKLKLITVDTLKKWNAKSPTIDHDKKFVRLLLLDIFGTKLLKAPTTRIATLHAGKIRFIRGNYIKMKTDELSFANFSLASRYFQEETGQGRCASNAIQFDRGPILFVSSPQKK